jgi:hypothetical protein
MVRSRRWMPCAPNRRQRLARDDLSGILDISKRWCPVRDCRCRIPGPSTRRVEWQPVLSQGDHRSSRRTVRAYAKLSTPLAGSTQPCASQFAVTPVGIARLTILIKTLGGSDDHSVASTDWHGPYAKQHLVPSFQSWMRWSRPTKYIPAWMLSRIARRMSGSSTRAHGPLHSHNRSQWEGRLGSGDSKRRGGS